jgi:hypothetical protein
LLRRDLAAVTTVHVSSVTFGITEGRAELDSHADTMVLSDNTALLIHDFGCPVRVHSYDELVAQHEDCETVMGVLAHDHPSNGETYFLIFHQAVLIPDLKVSILSPMQMHDNDLLVNDKPKSMALTPTSNHHCIIIHWHIGNEEALFPYTKPTREEFERSDLELQIDMMY